MTVYLGADHRGFELKELLKAWLPSQGYTAIDCGNFVQDREDDYPEFAFAVAQQVKQSSEHRGILCCGSGVGIDIAANKMSGIRSGLVFDLEQARLARHDDDINVLSLAADFTDHEYAKQIVLMFLTTSFSGQERHARRIQKLHSKEHQQTL
jgi:ribose 5-phosphate isomerase B